jgi:hypothetical protein
MATRLRRVAALAAAALVPVLVAACAPGGASVASVPAATVRPAMTVSPTVNQTRAELVRVLSAANLILADTQVPIRPVESPLLAAAPRAVFQVTLPADPARGFIVVYEFTDAERASAAAAEEQLYLASGPGRIQTPEGTVHVLRQVGPTVVLYEWLPGAARDPAAPDVQRVLETLGVGYPIAS